MTKTFICAKEKPLHTQISEQEKYEIEEMNVSGFLGEDDFEILTAMSQEKGVSFVYLIWRMSLKLIAKYITKWQMTYM